MSVLLGALLLGIIPAAIAQNKGRNFITWWIYGTLLFIIALPHSLILKRDIDAIELKQLSEGLRKCPYCAEMIKKEAILCKHCNRESST